MRLRNVWREGAQGGASQPPPALGVDWTPIANEFIRDSGLNGDQVTLMLREASAGNAPFQPWTWDKEPDEVLRNLTATAGPPSTARSNLWEADLRYASLEGTELYGARLRSADLAGARLHGANLAGRAWEVIPSTEFSWMAHASRKESGRRR